MTAARRACALLLPLLAAPFGAAQAACEVAVDPVAFGTIDPTRESTGTGRVVVTCDDATGVTVELSAPSGTRRMAGPSGAELAYELYQDAANAVAWGSGVGGRSARGASVSAGDPARLTIYGVIPSQAGILPGQYLDQLQVTLTF